MERARQLAAQGEAVVAVGRSAAKVRRHASELGIEYVVSDAAPFEEVDACLQRLREQHSSIDVAVNCVGSLLLEMAQQTTEQEFAEPVSANLGVDLPAEEIAAVVSMNRVRAIALSLVYPTADPAVVQEINHLRRCLPDMVSRLPASGKKGNRNLRAYGDACATSQPCRP